MGIYHNAVRLEDINVKSGPNPADRIACIRNVAVLDATTNVLDTPFAPGTQVIVVPFAVATVDANGQVTLAANPEPAAAGAGGYLILGRAHETQGGVVPD